MAGTAGVCCFWPQNGNEERSSPSTSSTSELSSSNVHLVLDKSVGPAPLVPAKDACSQQRGEKPAATIYPGSVRREERPFTPGVGGRTSFKASDRATAKASRNVSRPQSPSPAPEGDAGQDNAHSGSSGPDDRAPHQQRRDTEPRARAADVERALDVRRRREREKEKEREKERAKQEAKERERERARLRKKMKALHRSLPPPAATTNDRCVGAPRYYADVNENCPASKFDVANYKLYWGSFKDYEIHFTKKLGEGTYGSVYLATHLPTGNTVVAKTIKPPKKEERKRRNRESQMVKIQREVKILRQLADSRDIVKFIDQIKSSKDHLKALIFEYVENPNYKEVFRGMTPRTACKYLYHLVRALDFCHGKGIIHRDVKGANVLYDPTSEKLRLIDWGFGTWYRRGVAFDGWPGTRYYKSPDLFLHYRFYDYSVDMWAFACVMASIIFQREPMFKCKSDDNKAQLFEIAQYLGTNDYKRYLRKYDMPLMRDYPPGDLKGPKKRRSRVDWTTLIRDRNERFCSPEALDLLDQLLVWDHEKRLSARETLAHAYFDPVRDGPTPDLAMGRSRSLAFAPSLDTGATAASSAAAERLASEAPLLPAALSAARLDSATPPRS